MQTLSNHPLLVALSSGNTDIRTLRELLAQHHLYSRNFTRFLCMLIVNLTELEDVRSLLQNLLEELGADQRNGRSHAELFLVSMQAVGVVPQSRSPLKGTTELTAAMFGYCRSSDPLEGLAAMCLGAEAIVPFIYSPIIEAMKSLDLPAEGRRFFELHVVEDESHALAMLKIIMRLIDNADDRVARVRDIAGDMIGRRIRFLDDVWAETGTATISTH